MALVWSVSILTGLGYAYLTVVGQLLRPCGYSDQASAAPPCVTPRCFSPASSPALLWIRCALCPGHACSGIPTTSRGRRRSAAPLLTPPAPARAAAGGPVECGVRGRQCGWVHALRRPARQRQRRARVQRPPDVVLLRLRDRPCRRSAHRQSVRAKSLRRRILTAPLLRDRSFAPPCRSRLVSCESAEDVCC